MVYGSTIKSFESDGIVKQGANSMSTSFSQSKSLRKINNGQCCLYGIRATPIVGESQFSTLFYDVIVIQATQRPHII